MIYFVDTGYTNDEQAAAIEAAMALFQKRGLTPDKAFEGGLKYIEGEKNPETKRCHEVWVDAESAGLDAAEKDWVCGSGGHMELG